jgi:hypothetical protein
MNRLILLAEVVVGGLGGVEGLDDAQARQCLYHARQQHAHLVLHLLARFLEALAHTANDQACERKQYQHEACEFGTPNHQGAEEEDDGERLFEHHLHRTHHRTFHLLHIAGHLGNDLALLLFREIGQRQTEHLAEDVVADVAHHGILERCTEEQREVAEQVLQQEGDDHKTTDEHQCAHLSIERHLPGTIQNDAAYLVVEPIDEAIGGEGERGLLYHQRLDAEQHAQQRHHHRQGEEREDDRENIEEDDQGGQALVGRNHLHHPQEVAHGANILGVKTFGPICSPRSFGVRVTVSRRLIFKKYLTQRREDAKNQDNGTFRNISHRETEKREDIPP